ncbi:hypothetical protein V5P93_002174 [Actinokineospora auranticolor]|uniref:Uncharacterized protein n=1 Tax=Actinokineospora auranticolor TaxID=155976 RepID=A0A2S6GET4_9PSEU|nr:hypothetical protein [Actinokineospora auranticolor]PPK63738.1 hypothetical protein CLV40_12573 [Actinokineospora auranticolor]
MTAEARSGSHNGQHTRISTNPLEERRITTVDLNPFLFGRTSGALRDRHSAWFLLIGAGFTALVLLAAASSGMVGSFDEFQFANDFRRILRLPAAESDTTFPLVRDIPTWILTANVVAGTVLLHRHWQYMSKCLSGLARSGAIIAKPGPVPPDDNDEQPLPREAFRGNFNIISRLLRIDTIVRDRDNKTAFGHFVGRVVGAVSNRWLTYLVPLSVLSIVLAGLLVLGMRNSLFQTLAPSELAGADRAEWLQAAYRGWWASIDHPLAFTIYLALASYAIFIVLLFHLVGLIAVYVTIGMHFLVDPGADWLNEDNRHGWAPLARFYRTVMWANALLGTSLSTILISLGITNASWVAFLVVLYVLLMPVFTFVPWVLFRRAGEKAAALRIRQIRAIAEAQGIDPDTHIPAMAPYLSEIDRCRAATIRPLRMGTVSLFTHFTLVALPIVLAAAQIWLQ